MRVNEFDQLIAAGKLTECSVKLKQTKTERVMDFFFFNALD